MTDKLVFLPDTQFYTIASPDNSDKFSDQTTWCVDSANEVKMVSHLGDIVNAGDDSVEWAIATTAMAILDTAPSIAWAILVGNHDADNDTGSGEGGPHDAHETFKSIFGPATTGRFDSATWFGGADGRDLNSWQLFTANGTTYLHIALENQSHTTQSTYDADDVATIVAWVQSVLDANPGVPTILSTHKGLYSYSDRSNFGDDLWNLTIKDNDQIFLVANGHYGGECHQTFINESGSLVHWLNLDFQGIKNGGDGWLQYVELDGRTAEVYTYSPSLDDDSEISNHRFSLPDPNQPPIAYDYNFKQATSAKTPQLLDNLQRWNREDAMSLDGGDVMASADFGKIVGNKQPSTVYMVVEGGTQLTTAAYLLRCAPSSVNWYCYYKNDDGRIFFDQYGTNGRLGTVALTAQAGGGPFDKRIICLVNYGEVVGVDGGAKMFLDNTGNTATDADFNSENPGDIDLSSTPTHLGDNDATAADAFVGEIPGIWAANVAHTDDEVAYVMEKLRDKYTVDGWGYDGTNSYTTVTDVATLDLPNGDWSLGGWVKVDSIPNTYGTLFARGSIGATPSCYIYLADSDDGIRVRIVSDDGTDLYLSYTGPGASTEWQHVLVTYKKSTTTTTIYVDGVDVINEAVHDLNAITVNAAATFGDGSLGSSEIDGTLRDWFKTDRLITAAEIAELVANGYAEDMADGAPSEDNGWNIVMNAAEASNIILFNANGTNHECLHSNDGEDSYVTGEYK